MSSLPIIVIAVIAAIPTALLLIALLGRRGELSEAKALERKLLEVAQINAANAPIYADDIARLRREARQ